MIELEREGNLIPNPTNPKYQNRNPRLDVVQSLSGTRSNLAKALKLFSSEDTRSITSRKRAFDKASDAIIRSSKYPNNNDNLLA
jgi:D-arabinose 1-dehydrogenase-like Zn-dependent alcohol dehydrogenase